MSADTERETNLIQAFRFAGAAGLALHEATKCLAPGEYTPLDTIEADLSNFVTYLATRLASEFPQNMHY